jgi:hypothetical protein
VKESSFPADRLLPPRAATLSEALDAGFILFRRSLVRCLPLSLFAVLLGQLPSAYLLSTKQSLSLADPKDLGWWALMMIAAVGTLWCWLAIMLRQRAALVPSTLAADCRLALVRLPAALGVLVFGVCAVALGAVLLVIPGIYLIVAFWPALALVAFESASPREALDGALQLARGSWRPLAAHLLVVIMTLLGLFVMGTLVALFFIEFLQPAAAGTDAWVMSGVTGLLSAVFQPLFIAFGLAAYADLRHRRAQIPSSASSSA